MMKQDLNQKKISGTFWIFKEFENPEGPEILIEEVRKAIKHLKENKAPGKDGIIGEQLKALDEESLKILTNSLNDIYNNVLILNDLKQCMYLSKFLNSQRQ